MSNFSASPAAFSFGSAVFRLLLAMAVGGILGMERESKRKEAGFRTYMLVAVGASLTMILSQYLDYRLSIDWAAAAQEIGIRTDLSRLGAQVINGIGFLGAGTIIVTGRQQVKGLTTAAGLWAAGCMGIAVGAGFTDCALISCVLVLVCMRVLPLMENAFLSRSKNVIIYMKLEDIDSLGRIAAVIKGMGFHIYDTDISRAEHDDASGIDAVFSIRMPKRRHHFDVLAALSAEDGILSIEEI